MTDGKKKKLRRVLQESRHRLLCGHSAFAAPLTQMLFVAVTGLRRMSANSACIFFDAAWLEKLPPRSLDFALAHQLMHLQLGHDRRERFYTGDRFHLASDIVANAELESLGFTEDKLPGIGEIYRETFFPKISGAGLDPRDAMRAIPFDPAALSPAQRNRFFPDSDAYWDRPDDRGENGVIVLSPEDPDPEWLVLPPEVLEDVRRALDKLKLPPTAGEAIVEDDDSEEESDEIDYTDSRPSVGDTIKELRGLRARDEEELGQGDDVLRERLLHRARPAFRDWRALLDHFLTDETRDYTFTPPDKRMQELDFFLPDYGVSETQRLNVLFMVDISASLTDRQVSLAGAEIAAAIDQFAGLLCGTAAFFDTKVRRTVPLTAATDMLSVMPSVGGGTDFACIFDYVQALPPEERPSQLVVMTDGQGDFPDISRSMDIPVLWLLTSDRVRVPWGQAAYFGD